MRVNISVFSRSIRKIAYAEESFAQTCFYRWKSFGCSVRQRRYSSLTTAMSVNIEYYYVKLWHGARYVQLWRDRSIRQDKNVIVAYTWVPVRLCFFFSTVSIIRAVSLPCHTATDGCYNVNIIMRVAYCSAWYIVKRRARWTKSGRPESACAVKYASREQYYCYKNWLSRSPANLLRLYRRPAATLRIYALPMYRRGGVWARARNIFFFHIKGHLPTPRFGKNCGAAVASRRQVWATVYFRARGRFGGG